MEYRRFDNTIVLRVDRGEEVVSCIEKIAGDEEIQLAHIAGLGVADSVKVGLYDVDRREFLCKEFHEPMEITSLIGNIIRQDGQPYLHLHITCADAQQHCIGGHLKSAQISGTAEIFITVINAVVGRRIDDIGHTGLNIFDFPQAKTADR